MVKPFLDILQSHYGFNDNRIYIIEMTKVKVPKTEEYVAFDLYPLDEEPSDITTVSSYRRTTMKTIADMLLALGFSLCLLIAAVGPAESSSLWLCWLTCIYENRRMTMGPHPKDLFGPEPTFTEVEKQWEEAAPDTTSGGEWITISLLAIIVAS